MRVLIILPFYLYLLSTVHEFEFLLRGSFIPYILRLHTSNREDTLNDPFLQVGRVTKVVMVTSGQLGSTHTPQFHCPPNEPLQVR